MSTIVTRAGKGSPLTNTELDSNFSNLNTDKAELSGANFTGNLSLGDNVKAQFGASNDLQIFHDGVSSTSYFIEGNATGNMEFRASGLRLKEGDGGNYYFLGIAGGSSSIYHNGSKKLETTSTGISISNDANFPDFGKAIFGASNDLQIYHDGFNSYIRDIGTGNLNILADELKIMNASGTENKAFFVSDGGAYLYHNNSAKLETTSTGIDVTGSVVADGLVSAGTAFINLTSRPTGVPATAGALWSAQTETGNYGILTKASSTDSFTYIGNTGSSATLGTSYGSTGSYLPLDLQTSDTKRLRIASNGDISFYNDSAAQGLFWDSSTSRLGLGATSPSAPIHVIASSPELRLQDSDDNGYLSFNHNGANSYISTTQGALLFRTGGTSEKFRINADGSSVFSGAVSATGLTVSGNLATVGVGGSSAQLTEIRLDATSDSGFGGFIRGRKGGSSQ